MNRETEERIRAKWAGEAGRELERVDLGRPASYREWNARICREWLRSRVVERLAPASGLRVLDAGCGTGLLADALAGAGAAVTAVDLVPRFVERARARAAGPRFVEGNLLDALGDSSAGPFDALVLAEVIEDYPPAERFALLGRVLDRRVPRVLLAFRGAEPGGFSRWIWSWAGPEPIEPMGLLRWVHTTTPYRLDREEVHRVRTACLQLEDLRLEDPGG